MLYFVVNKDGSEWVFDNPPLRDYKNGIWVAMNDKINFIQLPLGSTKKICGWETSWNGGVITKKTS